MYVYGGRCAKRAATITLSFPISLFGGFLLAREIQEFLLRSRFDPVFKPTFQSELKDGAWSLWHRVRFQLDEWRDVRCLCTGRWGNWTSQCFTLNGEALPLVESSEPSSSSVIDFKPR